MYGYYTQRHKVFISFYHHDDQVYKNYIDRYLHRLTRAHSPLSCAMDK